MTERRGQLDKDAPFFRHLAQRAKGEPIPREQDPSWLLQQAKDRLAAANAAIGTTRTFFFALASIAAYIGVVVWGTTDEQLLRISPVKLPIIGVEVPLTGFYVAVPWLFVLLHFNLIIHLGLTSKKLKAFLDQLAELDQRTADNLRNDVANFPLAQWMAGKHERLLRGVLVVLVWITLVLLPPFLLLWMELRFLAFQEELFTWVQAAAVAADVVLIISFRAWFERQIQPETSWLAGWRELGRNAEGGLGIFSRLTISQPLFRYPISLIPLGLAGYLAVGLSELVNTEKVASCVMQVGADDMWPEYRYWLFEQYRLNLREKLITRNTPPPSVENGLHSKDPKVRNKALGETLEFDLKERSLRGANFSQILLPHSDLRWAQLEGADLREAQLEGANLGRAQLEGADLSGAQLEGAKLRRAQLEGAVLTDAGLSFADLRGAKCLEIAAINGTDFGMANLMGTFLDPSQPPPDIPLPWYGCILCPFECTVGG